DRRKGVRGADQPAAQALSSVMRCADAASANPRSLGTTGVEIAQESGNPRLEFTMITDRANTHASSMLPWWVVAAVALLATSTRATADKFTAVEHKRQTVYHSPQKPGFTSWVGAWTM